MAVNKDRRGVVIRPALALAADPNWPEGESVALRVNKTTGALKTEVTGAGSGGTSATDGDTFIAGSSALTPAGGVYDDTVANLAVGKVGEVRLSLARALHSNIRNNAGTEMGTLANPFRVQEVGGGGAATIADGADVTEGALADAKVVGDNSGTVSAKLRGLNTTLTSVDGKVPALGQALAAASTPVVLTAAQITTLTPPAAITGFATAAKQPALGTAGTASTDVITVQGIASGTAQPVSGTVTANLGTIGAASTAAKQPALGTAGTASADVISIQGIASMTKLLVTPDSVALPANQSCNVAQINGVSPLMGAGNTGTGSPRVTIATDQAAVPVSQSGTWNVGNGKTCKGITGSASATFTAVAAVTSKRIKVVAIELLTASTTAVTVTFKDGAAGTAIRTYPLQAIASTICGLTQSIAIPAFLFATSAGVLLELSFSAAQTVTYNLTYFDDDAT